MLEVDEDLQRLAHDVVRALALHVDDEADAAGVVLGARVVQTLGGRREAGVWTEHGRHILQMCAA